MPRLSERGVIHILVLLILLAGIGVGVYLVQTGNLKLFSKATNPPIVFKSSTGAALPTNSSGIPQTTSPTIKIELTSTLGPPVATSYPTPSYTYPTPSDSTSSLRVFVTSTTYNGNLGGTNGADQKCQDRANAANLGGSWKAWLSGDSSTAPYGFKSASERLNHADVPYKLLNGDTVANNWSDLTTVKPDGTFLRKGIDITELGIKFSPVVWTNTKYDGSGITADTTKNCWNWQLIDWSGYVGKGGWYQSPGQQWTDSGTTLLCNTQAALYCFEQSTSSVQGVSSVSGPITVGTVSYRIAENPTDLSSATEVPYNTEPTIIDYTFKDSILGSKFIWVDFQDTTGKTDRRSAQIDLVAPTPTPSPSPSPTPSPSPSPALLPDLIINKIEVLSKAKVRGKNSINMTVQNTGGDIAKGGKKTPIKVSLTITQPDGKTLGSCDAQFNGVNKGRTTKVQVRNCPAFKVSGSHTILAQVDSTNVVSESNENNNSFSTTVNVSAR